MRNAVGRVGVEDIRNSLKNLKNPNIWSYAALSTYLFLEKNGAEGKGRGEERHLVKREVVEYVAKNTRADFGRIRGVLEETRNALISCGYRVRIVKVRALSPVLTGSSEAFGKTIFEVGLHFHPFLNVPYIPGSTIKGAVRAGAFELLTKAYKKERRDAEEVCNRVFGDKDCAGLVGFSDALPVEEASIRGNRFLLIPDVMTPHYNRAVDESVVNPNPVVHLVVAPNTKFQFYIYFKEHRWRRRLSTGKGGGSDELIDVAETVSMDLNALGIVDQAVLYSFYKGVGAKTSVGYSKFEITEYIAVG